MLLYSSSAKFKMKSWYIPRFLNQIAFFLSKQERNNTSALFMSNRWMSHRHSAHCVYSLCFINISSHIAYYVGTKCWVCLGWGLERNRFIIFNELTCFQIQFFKIVIVCSSKCDLYLEISLYSERDANVHVCRLVFDWVNEPTEPKRSSNEKL